MISLSSPYPAAFLIAALVAALLFHLSRIIGPQRLVHTAYAAAAIGLIYLLGSAAFGWAFVSEGALLWVFLALFVLAGAMAARRRATLGAIGLPWLSALIQLGVVAYMFAPESFRKPPVTAALFLYFVFEAAVWLHGREEEAATSDDDDREHPPLFPPRRRRGIAEVSLAVAAVSIAFLLIAGPQAARVNSEAAVQQESQPEETASSGETIGAEQPASEANSAASDEAPTEEGRQSAPSEAAPQVAGHTPVERPATTATELEVYTARAGDTFKSIAKRVYGATSKWRAIAELNPDLKSKKLRAGQLVKLPAAPTR
ncbi:LysM peptidoglycan-binding domain-containing protein [Methylocystis sp. B8]|uniref:LysM peptidoglycan-binding domain-containing protein n=1 Tax=Methylocystis sp. B8 TaxID=544938 RepID=UPI001484F5E9|nr:LysM peptidoglycan-binding domain-containing protein [Methylocystis sp. B8]